MPLLKPSRFLLSIQARLAMAMVLMSLLVAGGLFFAIQSSFRDGFVAYLNDNQLTRLGELAEKLKEVRPDADDWTAMLNSRRLWRATLEDRQLRRATPPDKRDDDRDRRHRTARVALFDGTGRLVFGVAPPGTDYLRVPVEIGGVVVANIGAPLLRQASDRADRLFVASQSQVFLIYTLLTVLLGMLLSIPVSRYLSARLAKVSAAVQRLAARDYSVRLDPGSQDEIGKLVSHVNACAERLDQYESQQQRWLIEISHELRTPLSILQAEIEGIIDGIRPYTPDALQSLLAEVRMLSELVASLHQLSILDQGSDIDGEALRSAAGCDIAQLLRSKLTALEGSFEDAGISLRTTIASEPLQVALGDSQAEQIINNLWQNTLRYTDQPGQLEVALRRENDMALLCWQDSAPGLPENKLQQVFERLWRYEKSRNRATGGSGLGLSICKALVEVGGGRIDAQASRLGGLAIVIRLPLKNNREQAHG